MLGMDRTQALLLGNALLVLAGMVVWTVYAFSDSVPEKVARLEQFQLLHRERSALCREVSYLIPYDPARENGVDRYRAVRRAADLCRAGQRELAGFGHLPGTGKGDAPDSSKLHPCTLELFVLRRAADAWLRIAGGERKLSNLLDIQDDTQEARQMENACILDITHRLDSLAG